MKAAVIYTSVTGNTSSLAEMIQENMEQRQIQTDLIPVDQFRANQLQDYDIVAIGSYTWDGGEIPMEMEEVYDAFETEEVNHLATGVFGTGDSFFPYYCGAVDLFRDMLFVHTQLAVTLKVELDPQTKDDIRCEQFCERLAQKLMVTN